MILALLSLTAAVLCYTVSQLVMHGKLRWMKKGHSFLGHDGYLRKYKNIHSDKALFQLQAPLNNWYYNFFKIPYREAFPLSSTILSFTTDFYHLSQAGFKIFLALAFAPFVGWIWAGLIWLTWGIAFTVFYKIFSR